MENFHVNILRSQAYNFFSILLGIILGTAIFWYNLRTLSKDHIGNTMPRGTKMIPYLGIKNLKNRPYPQHIPM